MFIFVIFAALYCEPAVRRHNAMRNITSMALAQEIKTGWNLGNTLDALCTWCSNPTARDQETAWGNPVTTKAMIDTVKAAGFNLVRVCTSWDMMIGDAPNYTVKKEFIDRVQEVVDYVIDNGMFCIVNCHHEDTWMIPDAAHEPVLISKLSKLWEQIAARFKDYDEHLIFEALNEPRVSGGTNEWNGGTLENRKVLNNLMQSFVNVVRTSGGNNALRHLLIVPHNAGSGESWNGFVMPSDPAGKLMLSNHNYFPYQFCLETPGRNTWGTESDLRDLAGLVGSLYDTWVAKGIPVIVTEYGATAKSNADQRANYMGVYVAEMKKRGIPCVYWDNGADISNPDISSALLNRNALSWTQPAIVKRIMDAADTKPTYPLPGL